MYNINVYAYFLRIKIIIISIVTNDVHLGNYVSADIYDRNIMNNVCDFYQRSNSIMNDLNLCDSETLDNIHSTFSMHMYGCMDVCTCMDVWMQTVESVLRLC